MLAIEPLYRTTKGIDVFNLLKTVINEYVGFDKFTALTTDGAKAMTGRISGLWGLMTKEGLCCFFIHCIIHQKALCAKSLKLINAMAVVIKITNLIRGGSSSLSHRLFKVFLQECQAAYSDLPLHCDVRWLSAGKCLKQFFAIRKEIPLFLREHCNKHTAEFENKFEDINFLTELAFLTDITHHLNILNSLLQTKKQNLAEYMNYIKNFRKALQDFTNQLENNNFKNFPSCGEIKHEFPAANFLIFVSVLEDMNKQFDIRFKDIQVPQKDLLLFSDRFSVDINDYSEDIQLELHNLREHPQLQYLPNKGESLFRNLRSEEFPHLIKVAMKIVSIFGSTYRCESAFSVMKYIKSSECASLKHSTLQNLMRVALTDIDVSIYQLTEEKLQKRFLRKRKYD
ncbi:general transcription factor II-I repeat domain-containing protein 2A-like [Osmia bicornis bicornis]|uniref:general transcription factor II-I repeat domain-containing protein 2A-like n=1 Tax=Osmia bicornis bicornis TaxID=1437191 RepID=UPI001EAF7769|nr:general transcription factor II-I repeat domain-containing protein 2A-like [Osmia bicornis bicornis]